jgi:hypothetical protein
VKALQEKTYRLSNRGHDKRHFRECLDMQDTNLYPIPESYTVSHTMAL